MLKLEFVILVSQKEHKQIQHDFNLHVGPVQNVTRNFKTNQTIRILHYKMMVTLFGNRTKLCWFCHICKSNLPMGTQTLSPPIHVFKISWLLSDNEKTCANSFYYLNDYSSTISLSHLIQEIATI